MVKSKSIQCDEIWSFCYAKKRNVASAKAAPVGAGDVWTFTALDADSKLIVSWLVGSRDGETAFNFMDDLHGRMADVVRMIDEHEEEQKRAAIRARFETEQAARRRISA